MARREEESISHTNAQSKRQKVGPGNAAAIGKSFDQDALNEVVQFVKAHRSRALTSGERLDVLLCQAYLRFEHDQKQKKVGSGRPLKAPRISHQVAKMLRRKHELVQTIWAEYNKSKSVTTQVTAGNRNAKAGVIPDCRSVTKIVQEFVRERRVTRTRTVAKDVMDHLASRHFLVVDRSSPKAVNAALRAVQRFLLSKGYKRGQKKGSMNYRLKAHVMVMRDKYVKTMTSRKTRRIVYMDESYIHKNYCRHDDSLYDPNDEQDLTTIPMHKGLRYCFIAAIIDADPSFPEELRTPEQKARLLEDTLDIFQGGKKQTKDYHGMFDHDYFVNWMEKLLETLKAQNISNAIIVMDNAKYHKKLPSDVPKKNQKKQDLQEACTRYGIAFDEIDSKNLLWNKLEPIVAQIPPVIVQMAQREGHDVLFSPPHFSDLQPIETIWAVVKGEVGRQYTTDSTFKEVLVRLKRSFDNLQSETVQGCINKANQNLEDLRKSLEIEDGMDEIDDGSDVVSGTSDDEIDQGSQESDSDELFHLFF